MSKKTLIFNGTGVNYSWHFPHMARLDWGKLDEFESLYFISGGCTAFSVFLAKQLGLLTWTNEDFLQWNRHTSKVYGNNPVNGSLGLLRILLGVRLPLMTEEKYKQAYAIAVKPEFFDVKVKELPPNVFVPLRNMETDKIELAHAGSPFDEHPVYRVLFAATAIPKVFPPLKLGHTHYGDAMFAKGFLRWLRIIENKAHYFHNYNMVKNATYPNGEYHCLVEGKNGRKVIAIDNMKFLMGLHIESYPANFRKMNW